MPVNGPPQVCTECKHRVKTLNGVCAQCATAAPGGTA